MKKILMTAVMIGMAGGAYAAGGDEPAQSGVQFSDLEAMTASDLEARLPAGGIVAQPQRISARDQAGQEAPSVEEQFRAGSKKIKFGFVSQAERNEYAAKAALWVPEETLNTGAIDFKRGPFSPLKYLPEELVTCSFIPREVPWKITDGWTPKFKCRAPNGDKLKVKYGLRDGEVFSEVAATWVMTAIGAYADRVYPVRLNCPDCPSNPFVSEYDRGSWVNGAEVSVEDKLGERIEFKENSGIGFNEFYLIKDRVGAEALIGLAHFFGDNDTKADNQAIGCAGKDVVENPATGKAICLKPVVYMQDIGTAFGGGGHLSWFKAKMNYDAWAAARIWDDPTRCRLHLKTLLLVGTLEGIDPSGRDLHQIGEKARRMLVRRLSLLSRGQLIDIFTAARAPERPPRHTAEEWADLFLRKVEELRNPLGRGNSGIFSCPYDAIGANRSMF